VSSLPFLGEGDRNYELWLEFQKHSRFLIKEVIMGATGVMTINEIPQNFVHLEAELLVDSVRVIAGNNTGMRFSLNNVGAANYHINGRFIVAGGTPGDVANVNDTRGYLGQMPANGVVAGTPHASARMFLPFYSRKDTTVKTVHTEMFCGITAGGSWWKGSNLLYGTSAVSRIDVFDDVGLGVRVGSICRLYGISE
jgi:hypothetical protein